MILSPRWIGKGIADGATRSKSARIYVKSKVLLRDRWHITFTQGKRLHFLTHRLQSNSASIFSLRNPFDNPSIAGD